LEHAPELVDVVLAGDASLNDAYAVARYHKEPKVVSPTITIPATLEEAEARISEGLEQMERVRHYLGAFKRIDRISDGSKLGREIAGLERRLAEVLDGDEARSA
jgi:hypothetical protein